MSTDDDAAADDDLSLTDIAQVHSRATTVRRHARRLADSPLDPKAVKAMRDVLPTEDDTVYGAFSRLDEHRRKDLK